MSFRILLSRHGRGAASVLLVGAVIGAAACSEPSSVAGPNGVPDARLAVTLPTSPVSLSNGANASLCATVNNGSAANGTPLVLASCASTTNQKFSFMSNGEIHVYESRICVESNGFAGRAGDPVQIWRCVYGANQKWKYTAAHELRGLNGRCLAPSTGRIPATRFVLQNCDGSAAKSAVGIAGPYSRIADGVFVFNSK